MRMKTENSAEEMKNYDLKKAELIKKREGVCGFISQIIKVSDDEYKAAQIIIAGKVLEEINKSIMELNAARHNTIRENVNAREKIKAEFKLRETKTEAEIK